MPDLPSNIFLFIPLISIPLSINGLKLKHVGENTDVMSILCFLPPYFESIYTLLALLAAGHCGFGLGATPTAIANMQAITDRFGPSHLAFLVVPMVGAFFIDIANALFIKLYLLLPLFPQTV